MDNLRQWNKFRNVPTEAKKAIGGGRLKGMTDINPMWRLKTLTEAYGPAGIGWYYTIDKKELVDGSNGEIAAFVDITLYVKESDEWSKGIPGTGGSMYIAKEKNGLYTSDEAFKMALTDALSVSCKALGIGADVYWASDTKYTSSQGEELSEEIERVKSSDIQELIALGKRKGQNIDVLKGAAKKYYRTEDFTKLSKKSLEELKKRLETLPDVNEFEGTPFA